MFQGFSSSSHLRRDALHSTHRAKDPRYAPMKRSVMRLLIILVTLSTSAVAQLYDVQISATRKKIDQQKSRKGEHATVTTKEMAYVVTVENRSLKSFEELHVKYMIFYANAQPGNSEKAIEAHHKGSETLKNLSTHRTAQFETAPFKLEKEELDGGWYNASGGDGRAKDRVTGVWIRAYSDGDLVGEYANPTTVAKSREWQD